MVPRPSVPVRLCAAWPLLLAPFALSLTPSASAAQALFGDPSSTTGRLGSVRVDLGGGFVFRQGTFYDDATIPIVTPTFAFDIMASNVSDDMDSEDVFVTVTLGLAGIADVYGTFGQTRLESEGFDGERKLVGGGGIRLSPPQTGPVRAGLVLQGFHATGVDKGLGVSLYVPQFVPQPAQDIDDFIGSATGEERISFTRYDALLGFGVHTLPIVRPYGGLMLTRIDGRDEAELSGSATYVRCQPDGTCERLETTFTADLATDFEADNLLGLVAGLFVEAGPRFGLTAEGRFLSQTALGVTAHYRR